MFQIFYNRVFLTDIFDINMINDKINEYRVKRKSLRIDFKNIEKGNMFSIFLDFNPIFPSTRVNYKYGFLNVVKYTHQILTIDENLNFEDLKNFFEHCNFELEFEVENTYLIK
jgi:hypothetical protein